MTLSAFVGVFFTLAIVLGLLAVTMRVLKRVTVRAGAGRGTVRLEVLHRLSLGPRQGIAVVRVGTQVVAVSVGDGGVRALAEVPNEDVVDAATDAKGFVVGRRATPVATTIAAPVSALAASRVRAVTQSSPFRGNSLIGSPRTTQAVAAPRDFTTLLREGLRTAGVPLAMLAIAMLLAPRTSSAQAADSTTKAAATAVTSALRQLQTPQAPRTTTPQAPRGTALQPPRTPGAQAPAQPARSVTVPQPTARAAQPATVAAPTTPGASLDNLMSRAPQMDLRVAGDQQQGGLHLSGTVGIVVMMGLLTLLPTLLLMMTSFTRILIVLHFLKQAIGAQSAPPAQLISALALLLTFFVMSPTLSEVNRTALTPWLDGKIEQGQMLSTAVVPFRTFMLRQTRERDLNAFIEMSRGERPKRIEDTPTVTLMSAFVTSELRTSFQLGFALFLPFIVIDVVVSSVLMSMGMMMLPPALISLPFKLLLFVLVDGWTLVIQSVVAGFK